MPFAGESSHGMRSSHLLKKYNTVYAKYSTRRLEREETIDGRCCKRPMSELLSTHPSSGASMLVPLFVLTILL